MMKKSLLIILLILLFFGFKVSSSKAGEYDQTVNLKNGWNLISVPRLVDSHIFSAEETLANFDILVLDNTALSGWKTMAELGQTEFIPLYGYFINNKTGSDQTLTLEYKQDVEPNERLFSRTLDIGWNVLGIANPSYALNNNYIGGTDYDNVTNIFSSLSGCVSHVMDLTAGELDKGSVKVSDQWEQKVWNEVNQLNDLRELKAYAVFTTN